MNFQPSLPLPPQKLRFMGEDDQQFIATGDLCLEMMLHARALNPDSVILDIGCGYGRLAHAMYRRGFKGTYLGLDILPRHIQYCKETFAPYRNFRFLHLDIKNDRYNLKGKYRITDFDFSEVPAADMCAFFSVFTHLYENDILAYMQHAYKALKPDGALLFTAFLLRHPEDREETANSRFPMQFKRNDHCRFFNQDDPLHAISYDEKFLEKMAVQVGFGDMQKEYGSWMPKRFQEAMTQEMCLFDPFQDFCYAFKETDNVCQAI